MKGGLPLYVVVRNNSAVFETLAGKDHPLPLGWDAFLLLNLSFQVCNSVWWLDVDNDRRASEGLDEDLKTLTEFEDQVDGVIVLNVVVRNMAAVLEFLSIKDESLLICWDAFLVLDLGLHVLNSVWLINIKGDDLACESLYEKLHD